ncbi:MAG: hypothetical protein ACOZNI_25230 [Myxococcota bacterium]
MADLITHTCTAVLWKAATGRPHVATFVLGTCVPDFLGRVPAMGLTVLRWRWEWIPEWALYLWTPFHVPVGVVVTAWALSLWFRADERRVAFANLVGGGLLHIAVDLLQRHFGVGYLLLFPFSFWDYEIGVIGSEDTVKIVPVLVPLTAAAAWGRWGRRR